MRKFMRSLNYITEDCFDVGSSFCYCMHVTFTSPFLSLVYRAVPELCSEMKLSGSDSHIWRSHGKSGSTASQRNPSSEAVSRHNRSRHLLAFEEQLPPPVVSVADGVQSEVQTRASWRGRANEPFPRSRRNQKEMFPVEAPSNRLLRAHPRYRRREPETNCDLPW